MSVPDLNLYGQELKRGERDTLDDARDGRIEGGTWEHRARAREMAATAAKSAKLTLDAKAKREGGRAHHIGDFLPKDKLGKVIGEMCTKGIDVTAAPRAPGLECRDISGQVPLGGARSGRKYQGGCRGCAGAERLQQKPAGG